VAGNSCKRTETVDANTPGCSADTQSCECLIDAKNTVYVCSAKVTKRDETEVKSPLSWTSLTEIDKQCQDSNVLFCGEQKFICDARCGSFRSTNVQISNCNIINLLKLEP